MMKFISPFLISITIIIIGVVVVVSADDDSNAISPAQRGSWSDTARDLIAATQDDSSYRQVIVRDLLSASSHHDGNSFADSICSRPKLMRCVGNGGDAKGPATSPSWPVEINIRQFNGTVRYEKLPKATQILVIEESIIPVDVVDLMSRLPNGIENIRFVKSTLTTSGKNIFPSSLHGKNVGAEDANKNKENNNNDEDEKNSNSNNNNKNKEGQLTTLSSISFEHCKLDDSLFESPWLPTASLKSVNIIRSTFSSSSVAPLVANAAELDEVRILSNSAPINFRELLSELSSRTKLRTIDFQAVAAPKQGKKEIEDARMISAGEIPFPKNLVHLRLCNLSLTEIPKNLPPKLSTLELPFNSITTGGEVLGDILAETVLELFDFSNNSIGEYPKRFPASIKKIRMASNRLKGKVDFTNLPRQLEEISIAHNELSGGADLSKLPSQLEIFDIAYNKFSGTINMRDFPDSVRYMFLHFNEFTGRYDVSRLPLLSVKVLFGGNKWDSLIPKRSLREKLATMKKYSYSSIPNT